MQLCLRQFSNVRYNKKKNIFISLYNNLQKEYMDLLHIINTNDKLTISNFDNTLIDYVLNIPFTQRFI